MSRHPGSRRALPVLSLALIGTAGPTLAHADVVVLSWNDLGMHCMNQIHRLLSILPPYNNLDAQVIQKGGPGVNPVILTNGVDLTYSIPGNTTSVTKTDFWQYCYPLFGVHLPPDIGLTGKGLTGTLDWNGDHWRAEGIPITPFTDANPTVEAPFQQALVVAKDGQGTVLAESRPVIPVSTEIHCLGSGCHASEQAILNAHPREDGFNPNATPILCASCHADPALGTQGIQAAGYFSLRMHGRHEFIDETIPGINGCYRCHPGPQTRCLRGTMNEDHGVICQDCHGNMSQMASSIELGRIPWANEPACRDCHTAQYGEPVGQLYKSAKGHGGVMCSACHHSTHADYPSREPNDNANMVALQGHAGILSDCNVCHGTIPSGPGPHGMLPPTDVVEGEILSGVRPLSVYPSPFRGSCTIEAASGSAESGRLLVFDAAGRTIRMLRAEQAGAGISARWDGEDARGSRVKAGVYFVRWQDGATRAAAKVVLTE